MLLRILTAALGRSAEETERTRVSAVTSDHVSPHRPERHSGFGLVSIAASRLFRTSAPFCSSNMIELRWPYFFLPSNHTHTQIHTLTVTKWTSVAGEKQGVDSVLHIRILRPRPTPTKALQTDEARRSSFTDSSSSVEGLQ